MRQCCRLANLSSSIGRTSVRRRPQGRLEARFQRLAKPSRLLVGRLRSGCIGSRFGSASREAGRRNKQSVFRVEARVPTYTCECQSCHAIQDYYRTVSERHDTPACKCGGETKLVLMPTFVQDDIPPYVSTTTGRVIGSRKMRRDDLRRSNCREWEGLAQERKEAARRAQYDDERRDRKLDHAAREAYHQALTPAQRRLVEGR